MITFIVPTLGRPSLKRTLRSIECFNGDEILVVGSVGPGQLDERCRFVPHPPGGDWGHKERNFATPLVRGRYIAHIDDDDIYAADARQLMADAIEKTPDRPVLFRMRYPNGITLWENEEVRCGNVGTPMMLIPNVPEMLGSWGSFVGGDCAFLESSRWKYADYVWRPEIIALLGHNT